MSRRFRLQQNAAFFEEEFSKDLASWRHRPNVCTFSSSAIQTICIARQIDKHIGLNGLSLAMKNRPEIKYGIQ
jgi:hypothetical protein